MGRRWRRRCGWRIALRLLRVALLRIRGLLWIALRCTLGRVALRLPGRRITLRLLRIPLGSIALGRSARVGLVHVGLLGWVLGVAVALRVPLGIALCARQLAG